jgi:hypothetical protein
MATSTKTSGRTNAGSPIEGDNGASIVFGKLVIGGTMPAITKKGGGKTANPLDPTVLANLNAMLDAGGTEKNFVPWQGTNAALRSVVKGTFDKWSHAQEVRGTVVKLHFRTMESSPNGGPSPKKEDNDLIIQVVYFLTDETPTGAASIIPTR